FAPTVAAPNDVCANATRLGSVFSIQGVTCYAANDLNPYSESPSSCVNDELAGPDVFYEIGAGSGDSLHVSVTAEWGAALYLVDNCVSPVCLAGGLAEDSRTAPVIDYKFSTAGGYYLVVDGEEGSCGPYQLDGQIIHTATGVTGEEILPPLNLDVHPNPAGGPISLFAALPVAQSDAPILEIYNVAGKRVLRLEGAPGGREFSFVWDRRDRDGMPVASGVYFARLQVGGQSVVQKFVILR
ncbi:MAG: T9SS type A sorting domain-containing protein, partial [Candidatus Krumholzibacteria bacterium]|nr:T9SS type A sorting domain-containing protein [Candidatus Krumholzibacteria bacterium]